MAIAQRMPADFTSESETPSSTTGTYAELKRLIRERGLLDKAIPGYMVRVAIVQALFLGSLAVVAFVHIFWVQCLDALLLAFTTTQIGLIGHDAGHRQVFDSTLRNDILGLLQGNLLLGMSFSWWNFKHNAHHARPNEIDSDPDVDVPMIAFKREDVEKRHGFFRFMTQHQVWFFFPVLSLVGLALQANSIKFLFTGKAPHRTAEIVLLLLHYTWYFGLIFTFMPVWQGVIFILIHKFATGLYLGSIFAPNHKGMLITEHGSEMDFLSRQVLTARNVRANPIIDYWYGGLNYQIEHHLFPSMPRRHLGEAQRVVRAYCTQHGISYHETGFMQSYREILGYLYEISAPLRAA
jgi:fatty acid desaturase